MFFLRIFELDQEFINLNLEFVPLIVAMVQSIDSVEKFLLFKSQVFN